ncbi:hypothetical protein C8Q80DRAFT_1265570 [Daedaleopsis nitida]|nr:hypothetical protein C8Q80DRAFT_1265570 [Daedaleopsis nitida]
MVHYPEDDSGSDTCYDDTGSAGPLLPDFQSSRGLNSQEPSKRPVSHNWLAWRTRFTLPFRRRYVIFFLLVILAGTMAHLSGRFDTLLERLDAPPKHTRQRAKPSKTPSLHQDSPVYVTLSGDFDSPPAARPTPTAEVTETALPAHLRTVMDTDGIVPTLHLKDSLRNDTKYLTSFISAGFTNDQITMGNIIYLAMITGRVPILPPFTSVIEGGAKRPLPFSEIFDVPRMSVALNHPIVEWHKLKDIARAREENVYDELGCWNIMEVNDMHNKAVRGSYSTVVLALDISYTRAPQSVKLMPGFEHDSHSTFWALAKLAFPNGRSAALAQPHENPTRPSEHRGVLLPPDEHVLCYDFLYYTCALEPLEFESEKDYSPMWREVMSHAHWNRPTVALAQDYLRKLLGLSRGMSIPPFIAIHVRHGDFLDYCGDVPTKDCFAPLSTIARRVGEVRGELRERLGTKVQHVLMMSDEKDPAWWEDVQAYGWIAVDHKKLRTEEDHGNWYPVVMDAVMQSMAMGFVGTDRSTFSHMAKRRVMYWNNGATRMVKWGRIGADDH